MAASWAAGTCGDRGEEPRGWSSRVVGAMGAGGAVGGCWLAAWGLHGAGAAPLALGKVAGTGGEGGCQVPPPQPCTVRLLLATPLSRDGTIGGDATAGGRGAGSEAGSSCCRAVAAAVPTRCHGWAGLAPSCAPSLGAPAAVRFCFWTACGEALGTPVMTAAERSGAAAAGATWLGVARQARGQAWPPPSAGCRGCRKASRGATPSVARACSRLGAGGWGCAIRGSHLPR